MFVIWQENQSLLKKNYWHFGDKIYTKLNQEFCTFYHIIIEKNYRAPNMCLKQHTILLLEKALLKLITLGSLKSYHAFKNY